MYMTSILQLLLCFLVYTVFLFTGCVNDPSIKPQRISFSPDKDTLIGPGDTLSFCFEYPAERWWRYYLRIDSTGYKITEGNICDLTFPVSDTGDHIVVLGVLDSDKFLPDTVVISVRANKPKVEIGGPSQVVVNDTAVFYAKGSDVDGSVIRFLWSIDKKGEFWYSDTVDSFKVTWGISEPGSHIVRVKGIDDDGLVSSTDSLTVNVISLHPTVLLPADTSVFANETLIVVSSGADSNGEVTHYRWTVDGGAVSSSSDTLILNWGVKGAGEHKVVVASVDDDSLESQPDTMIIHVKAGYPVINPIQDAAIYVNDTLNLKAVAYDSNGTISGYRWTIDGVASANNSDTLSLCWNVNSYGKHIVTVSAFDNDSLNSGQDTIIIEVLPGFPVIIPVADTVISANDSLTVNCFAYDTNGIIAAYLWDIDGNGWEDTSTVPRKVISFTGKKMMRVMVGALDDDGFLCTDTFNVTFNLPPEITFIKPEMTDTLFLGEQQFPSLFKYEAAVSDPENDSVVVSLYLKESGDTFQSVYSGNGDSMAILINSPGEYQWKILMEDGFGNKKNAEGILVVIREHTICFTGHSIVTGVGGNDNDGGFRAGVLKGLRDSLGQYERLKAVGPLCTYNMNSFPTDDSCLAISGTVARDMSFVFKSFPGLKADIWVFMMGANAEYKSPELNNTISLIDVMLSRNQQSRVYVLNSPPFPETARWESANQILPSFNLGLANAVADRKMNGYKVELVDAFTHLTNEGVLDSALYTDHVHPNQDGYGILSQAILQVMYTSDSPAISAEQRVSAK